VGAGIHIVGQNVSLSQALVVGMPIELAFDRLLDPSSITRQTFVLDDLSGTLIESTPSYDPVARVVRLCLTDAPPLLADQTYRITIVSPQGPLDPSGLRAIDGAGLDPSVSPVIEFPVTAGTAYTGSDACSGATSVDFCAAVLPIFASKCSLSTCHSGALPAAGLLMTTAQGIESTAIGRVAQGSNTGTQSQAAPPGILFGVDMPIIGPDDPGNSWLMYKLLLAVPPPCSSTPDAGACEAGTASVEVDRYPSLTPPWSPLSSGERATLSNYIPGREMPYPTDPSAPLDGTATAPLTVDELDTVSTWVLQGAAIPAGGCAQ
jgi:hypothetical protein